MRISTAFRAFFAALLNRETAERVAQALQLPAVLAIDQAEPTKLLEQTVVESKPKTTSKKPESPKEVARQNEAITLLAALQREGRFVDFLQESLADYSDAQIGAAARSVHDDCAKVIQRFFALKPVIEQPEESRVEINAENFPMFQLSGNVSKNPPFSGKLVHSGWTATKQELPRWTGQPPTVNIIAPAEVEV